VNPSLPEYHRDLLKRLDEARERIQHENDGERGDAEAESFAKASERAWREAGGEAIPADAVLAILPSNADPLAPQDPERRARFERHLVEILEEAALARGSIEPAPVDPPPDGRETLSAFACVACRGSCCGAGGDHAYLTEETMARFLEENPGRTLAQIVGSFLDYLPPATTLNSCIYHGAEGCGLPRELRSPVCNTYRCAKLTRLRARLPQDQPPPVLAVTFDRGRWTRTALLRGSGVTILAEE
jgi:hypothetical protein